MTACGLFFALFTRRLGTPADALPRGSRRRLVVAALLATVAPAVASAADLGRLADSGLAVVPADAAFVSASLRLREQYDRIVRSNAWAALRDLPGVKRALDSFEEQRSMPGSPVSMVDTFVELPENAQAVELLKDMVSRDTFVYGEPSCVAFVKLAQKLQQAQQMAGLLSGPERAGLDGFFEFEEEMEEEDELDDEEAGVARRPRVMPVAMQAGVDALTPEELQKRAVIEVLADNLDLLVVPDVVWGFAITRREPATAQLERLESLARLFTQGNPDLADAVARQKVAGAEFVTLTLDGDRLPWDEIERELDAADVPGIDDVIARLRGLDLVVALGVVGDRVILSVGDSVDHLEKLVAPAEARLIGQPAFAPLLEHRDAPLTAVSYLSEPLAAAVAPAAPEGETIAGFVAGLTEAGSLSEEAAADLEEWLSAGATGYARRLPEPGPWLGYSFMTDLGYEGYAWDWSKSRTLDGSKRLDLLEHSGGAPVAVLVGRLAADPTLLDDLAAFVTGGWQLLDRHVLAGADRDRAATVAARLAPLGEKFSTALRTKLVPALADGQVGLVIDSKTKVKRPHRDLPASADQLPLPEPAIVLPLRDAKLFRDGLSDVFALSDELVDTLEAIDPDAVPDGYRVPDPEKTKVEAGSIWSFALPRSGLDDAVRPAIGVGERVAVFSLVPKQAGRLLAGNRLETGAQLTTFEEPLAAGAALDFAGLVDTLEPWIAYLARYGSMQQRDGVVDAAAELSAADENEQAKDALRHVDVVLDVARCLRAAVAETAVQNDATVTHWRNVIRDLPAKP
jgi:hypothetical protein